MLNSVGKFKLMWQQESKTVGDVTVSDTFEHTVIWVCVCVLGDVYWAVPLDIKP